MYTQVAATVATVLAGAALAVSLLHAGPPGQPGLPGPQGLRGPQGSQGPAGLAGSAGQTPYTAYDQVCWSQGTDQVTGQAATYYYPCTPNVVINPQP